MQKKRLLTFVLGLFLISFVSAYYGSYSSFSLSDLLDSIDSSTMILGGLFIIFFALSNFALVRAFKDNKAVAGVVSFVVSLFAVYGLNKTGFDFEELFYGFGISEGLLYTVLPLVLLAGVIYLVVKLKTKALFILGGLFIVISFTELIYAKGATILIGLALIGVGILLWRRKNPKPSSYAPDYQESKEGYAQKARELRAKQQYDYYKKLEEQQARQEMIQQRQEKWKRLNSKQKKKELARAQKEAEKTNRKGNY